MPIITQHRYYRSDAQRNRGVLYVFGDNVAREGYGGQAKEMRDEPNAVGVRTKVAPTMRPNDFFSDSYYDDAVAMIEDDLRRVVDHLEKGGIVVLPADGLGTGLSELPTRAPRIHAYLEARLQKLIDDYDL